MQKLTCTACHKECHSADGGHHVECPYCSANVINVDEMEQKVRNLGC